LEDKSKSLEQKLLAESWKNINLAKEFEALKIREQKANDLLRQKE
jgi:hypothetical protein